MLFLLLCVPLVEKFSLFFVFSCCFPDVILHCFPTLSFGKVLNSSPALFLSGLGFLFGCVLVSVCARYPDIMKLMSGCPVSPRS